MQRIKERAKTPMSFNHGGSLEETVNNGLNTLNVDHELESLKKDIQDVEEYIKANKNSTLFHSVRLEELKINLIKSLEVFWTNKVKK